MENKNIKSSLKLGFWGLITGFCNGLFGSGGGMIAVPALKKYASAETKKSHATAIAVVLPITVVSIFRYAGFCKLDYATLVAVIAGGISGSVTGAILFKKISSRILTIAFGVVMLITAVRLVAA